MNIIVLFCFRLSRSPIRDRRHYEHGRSSKVAYSRSRSHSRSRSRSHSRSRSRSRSHSPHLLRHDHGYHSPKRGQKSPPRTTSKSSKYSSHVPRLTSPHNSRSTRKSSHARPKYSRSPPKSAHPKSRSSSPSKDSKNTKKLSDSDSPGCYSSASKRKKSTKSPVKQYNPKVKLSETSLFAELVKDRQRRELAMKCLTQISTKPIDENEVVEIHDDSDTEQNNSKVVESNIKPSKNSGEVESCVTADVSEKNGQISKPEIEASNIKSISSSILDTKSKILEESQSPIVSKEEIIENGIEHSVEQKLLLTPPEKIKPEVIENRDFTKMPLPLPPTYPLHDEMSPDSEIKCSKKSIKDLPLPPGKFLKAYFYH